MGLMDTLRKRINPTVEELEAELKLEEVKAKIREQKSKGRPKGNSGGLGIMDYAKSVAENASKVDLVGDTSGLTPQKKSKGDDKPW